MVRIVISDPKKGKAYQIEPEKSQFEKLIGLKIGDQFEGEKIDLPGYKLEIKGGSDEEGFPMRKDVKGEGRTQPLLSGGTGYKPKRKGLRKRRTVRGHIVSKNIAQLNTIIKKHGEKSLEESLGLETEEIEETEKTEEE
ncbi:30S ribosomal protein S6 [candidate division MSBL1 archaeon SCGC-AAA382A03]|uniref:Small ribosomal subunit protein eS6 n=1 Tax=candidate division MSBL1 archaeon SCGC-AAA382A03 TaxID=1698278 RepID=A0A133VFT8_9EURY|nr:30S ribosomal protein S6 [candidate division MSBL1 archaeon SCGC-AAA382A03]